MHGQAPTPHELSGNNKDTANTPPPQGKLWKSPQFSRETKSPPGICRDTLIQKLWGWYSVLWMAGKSPVPNLNSNLTTSPLLEGGFSYKIKIPLHKAGRYCVSDSKRRILSRYRHNHHVHIHVHH